MDKVTIDRYLCLTEDRSRVVPETDPAARWLHWRPGDQVPRAEAERLGAVAPPAPEPKQQPAPRDKAAAKPGDKQSRTGARKGGS